MFNAAEDAPKPHARENPASTRQAADGGAGSALLRLPLPYMQTP